MSDYRRHRPTGRRLRVTVADVIEHVAWEGGLSVEAVIGRRLGFAYELRSAAVWLAYRLCRCTRMEIARAIQRRHQRCICLFVAAAERLRVADPDFRALTDRLVLSLEAAA